MREWPQPIDCLRVFPVALEKWIFVGVSRVVIELAEKFSAMSEGVPLQIFLVECRETFKKFYV